MGASFVRTMSAGTTRPLVLYVEDNPVNLLLMQALFDRLPQAELLLAATGTEAMALARERRFALLLLDIGLPDCRGDELLGWLRALPGGAGVPAVAVTAEFDFDGVAHGFDERWEKPLDLLRVLTRLAQLIASAAAPALRRQPAAAGRRSPAAAV